MFSGDKKVSLEYAWQQHRIAEHLLTVTYPLTKDTKLLMGIIYNLCGSLDYALDSLLQKAKLSPESNWRRKLLTLKMNKLVSEPHSKFIAQVQEAKALHRACPTEFVRGDRIVMCSKDYQLKTITPKEIKEWASKTASFLTAAETVINRK
ncbi:MAG: hypothetical protein WCV90_04295 [Candidatus Woesearchaeota archaeon]